MATMTLTICINNPAFCSAILQKKFTIEAETGKSIRDFLARQCGISNEYIKNKIATIFLNSQPVDDIDNAIIKDDSVLALSGAMPGLVGAIMRSGSIYSSMRNGISYHENDTVPVQPQKGLATVKIFNTLISELGPIFLKRGVYIPLSDIADFFSRQSICSRLRGADILIDDKPIRSQLLVKTLNNKKNHLDHEVVFFSVKYGMNTVTRNKHHGSI